MPTPSHTPSILFIAGTGRSGTNITKAIFKQQTEVATLPFEYRFIIDPDGLVDFYNNYLHNWSPFMSDRKIKRLETYLLGLANRDEWHYFLSKKVVLAYHPTGKKLSPKAYYGWELNKWIPNYEQYVQELIQSLVAYRYHACWPGADSYTFNHQMYFGKALSKPLLAEKIRIFLQKCIQSILDQQQKTYFVEDNTHNILFAPALFDFFPNAKLLHLIRNPRDVIASLNKQRWTPNTIKHNTIWYAEVINRWLQVKNQLSKDCYLEVKLEELVQTPEKIIPQMCAFAQIPFQESMLKVDLSKSNSGRYQAEMKPQDIDFMETYLENILKYYDY